MKRFFLAAFLVLCGCASKNTVAPETPPKSATTVEAAPEKPPVAGTPSESPVFNAPATNEKAPFIPHMESKPLQSYLAMNLPYAPYQALYEQVQKVEGLALTNRGEAHITVITPLEYEKVLKKKLSIQEIHQIAESAKIQDAEITPVCIGRGQKEIHGKTEKTYFVVVESPALVDLRGRIEEAYIKNGGTPHAFIPERYSPHVTLGFTLRDLHHEDGVRKDRSHCIYKFPGQD